MKRIAFIRRAAVNAAAALLALGMVVVPAAPAQADTLYESYTAGGAASGQGVAWGDNWTAQSFTTTSAHNITSVRLPLYRSGSPGTVFVSIRAASGGLPTGSDLTITSFNSNDLPEITAWRTITFPSPIDLANNMQYAIVMAAPGAGSSDSVGWIGACGSSYSGGAKGASSNSGVNWTAPSCGVPPYEQDLWFEVYSSTVLNHAPVLSNVWVTPDPAYTTDPIYYYVHYYDEDGDPPGSANVRIDGVDHTMTLSFGSAADGNYVYGPFYLQYNISGHSYSFSFNDGRGGTACLPAGCITTYTGPTVTIPLGIALDTTGATWSSGGGTGKAWYGQSYTTNDGVDAARSGAINDGDYTWMDTSVYGPCKVGFRWWVSSEPIYDLLSFSIDGVEQARISGTVYAVPVTADIPPGYHMLEWKYSKDGSGAVGQDCGYVDQVLLPAAYGRVGVGVDPPEKILHVKGSGPGSIPLFQRGTDSAGFIIERTPTNRWLFGINENPTLGYGFVISTIPEGTTSVPRLVISPSGNVTIPGSLSAGAKNFRIDHPLDPADKYLLHSFVESPDMLNLYSGNVVLDEKGEAVVELPAYFGALNRDYTYQLDAVGENAALYVSGEIAANKFTISGGRPGLKVFWQVAGTRADPYATAHPIVVEQGKPAGEKGFYMHPVEWGQPRE